MRFFFTIEPLILQEFIFLEDVVRLYQNKFLNKADFQRTHPYELLKILLSI